MDKTQLIIYITVLVFIVLDVVTGLLKAFKNKEYTSTTMRQGLYHKIGSILCIAFATLLDYTQSILDIGLTIPILKGICIYIILMEITSIIENICSLNPDIMPEKITQYFKKLK